MKPKRLEVSRPALMARLNRKLAHESQRLCAARSERERQNVGNFFIVDSHKNVVVEFHIDPVALARELGVLASWEDCNDF